ncbi:MAG TPA: tRNA lysidine(34) synthetase TilS [Bacteroidales bacterium]|nr:tRNA lysidine(34) synthetase TilS [Bacteroidales bacterium]
MNTHPRYAYFDAHHWRYPLLIRAWEAGDTFQPLGSKGRKKVSDFFTDLKLSLIEKKRVQILCRADNPKEILWIIGFRIEHRFRVREHTEKVVILKAPSPQ